MSLLIDELPDGHRALSALDLARLVLPYPLDAVQAELLATPARQVVLNCHRQWGKTTCTAVRAVHQATSRPRQLIVVISPTLEQSKILTQRCRDFAVALSYRVTTDGTNPRSVRFPNGSVILPVAADADHARGWSAHLLIIDEAAFVPDEVYAAVTPLVAATQGDLWLLSTPNGKRGFFFHEFMRTHPSGLRLTAPAEGPDASGRIGAEFLALERARKTTQQFAQSYLCEFTTTERSVFRPEVIERAFQAEIPPFLEHRIEDFRQARVAPHYYLGVDLGKKHDHAVIVVVEFRTVPTGTVDPYYRQPLFRRELRLRAIEQFPLGTPYLEIVPRVARLCHHPQIAHHGSLVLDATGHGECVVELVQREHLPVHFLPVNITGGEHAQVTRWGRNVPKHELITRLELILEQNLLGIAAQAPQSAILRHELLQYERIQHRDGHATYAPADTSTHDDTILATALATWWAWENKRSLLSGDPHKPLDPW